MRSATEASAVSPPAAALSSSAATCRHDRLSRKCAGRCFAMSVRASASVASVVTFGMTSAAAAGATSAPSMTGPLVAINRHARDRRFCRRLIDAAARIAKLAWHAGATVARIGALARPAPWPIRMVLTNPSAVIANATRHDDSTLARVSAEPRSPFVISGDRCYPRSVRREQFGIPRSHA